MIKEQAILEYLDPKYLYVPVKFNDYKLNTNIYKLEKVKNNTNINYFPISGKIIKTIYLIDTKNQKQLYLVILNNYKEIIKYQKKYELSTTKLKYLIITKITKEITNALNIFLSSFLVLYK